MSEGRVVLQEKDYGNYIFWARPCAHINEESVKSLAERAAQENLDFVGIVYGKPDAVDETLYSGVLNLSENPEYTIKIRNIGAGLYSREFLKSHNIAIRENADTIFPDLDVLWRTFIYAQKARFADSSAFEEVLLDTVWINDTAAAFDVNRRYDYIRSILMEDWDRWCIWRPYFCLQRYRCYFEILHWMKEEVAWEFAERMVVDIHRSRELDEMNDELFTLEERTALRVVDFDPGFLKRYYLGKVIYINKFIDAEKRLSLETERANRLDEDLDNARRHAAELEVRLEEQKQNYETSTTFRVGRIVMFIPLTLKKKLKKALGRS